MYKIRSVRSIDGLIVFSEIIYEDFGYSEDEELHLIENFTFEFGRRAGLFSTRIKPVTFLRNLNKLSHFSWKNLLLDIDCSFNSVNPFDLDLAISEFPGHVVISNFGRGLLGFYVHLFRSPVYCVKFSSSYWKENANQNLIEEYIRNFSDFGVKVAAEGVDDVNDYARAVLLGFDCIEGSYFPV